MSAKDRAQRPRRKSFSLDNRHPQGSAPQRHPVVQGTRAQRAAGAFTGRTDLNVTSVMGGGTLANLGKLSLPETLTKNAQAMAPGYTSESPRIRRRWEKLAVPRTLPPF